ncbi:MAG: hypothetical protein MSJ26_00895 [Oscillospiraceae bacterium]|nr:hypothetical protein [Oscillospiraceae bacterium]
MSDKFSLDDILNEYSGSGGSSEQSLDEILNSYPATKNYEDSGLAEIFDSRSSTTDIDLSGISISMPQDYPTPEEIRRSKEQPVSVHDIPEDQLTEEERIKKSKQIDYEIISGDYDRKYMPDELKTEAELKAEGKTEIAAQSEAPAEDKAAKKKVKVKPAKKKFASDFGEGLKGVHSSFDDDEFERKYGNAPLFTAEERDELMGGELHEIPFEITPPSGSSLSEKLEREAEFNEKYNSAAGVKHEHRVRPEKVTQKQEAASPLDKYAAIDDIDSILGQYERKEEPQTLKRSETSPLKGFTDIFNKIMAKEEAGGESELLEESRKLRHSDVAIERKKISDIGLDLSDKMIKDTSQINIDKTNAELEKLSALKERRSKKIKDFVLMGGEEENTPEENAEAADNGEIEDFESLVDAPDIQDHITGQKNKLIFRLAVLFICFAATTYMAVANDFKLPVLESLSLIDKRSQPDVFLFINSVIGVVAGFVASQTISGGISKLLSGKADCDSLSAMTLISCLLTSMISLADSNMVRGSYVYIFTPVAIGSLIFNTIGKLLIISRTQRSFSFISGDNDRYALFVVDDEERAQNFTRGSLSDFPVLAGMQKTEMITDFLKTSYAGDSTDRFSRMVCPIIAAAGLVIGVVAALLARVEHGTMGAVCVGLSTFSACASICSCFGMMLVVNLPMEKASVKYSSKQGAIVGYDSIEEFGDVNSIMIDAASLFPPGSIILRNIKSFPDSSIDEAIVEAASLTSQSGSVLKNMFYDIIVGKTEMLDPVESYIYEDSMGLCGWINNKRVLLGNRELMQNHSIEGLPSIAKENEYTDGDKIAVYLSISGQLSAMFIVELTASYQIKRALKELERGGVAVMLRSVDSMLSVSRLSEMFEVTPLLFKLIPFRLHPDYEKSTEYSAKRPATLVCSGRFASFAQLILGANRLRGTISAGIAIQAAEILLGILLTLAMVLLRSMAELTVTNILLYNFVFVCLYFVFQAFRKV